MNAEIITIGTELLLGDIVDTNAAHIARTIRDIGLDLYIVTTVGDNQDRVAQAVSAAMARADVIITTGGLGPTVDDVTRAAVAQATGRPLEFRPELLDQIASRFERWGVPMSPNNRQQAYVPAGAIALENPVGTAPCFIVETGEGAIISLPGVPREMVHLLDTVVLPYLKEKMGAPAVILSRILRTAGVGESRVDAAIQDLERLSNPTVGLAAHAGQTDIRITAKAGTVEEAAALIEPIAREVYRRLGAHVYGEGEETVEEVVCALLRRRRLTLAIAESGVDGQLTERLRVGRAPEWPVVGSSTGSASSARDPVDLAGADHVGAEMVLADLAGRMAETARQANQADLGLSVLVDSDSSGRPQMALGLAAPTGPAVGYQRGYGGPPEYVATWASTLALDRLRRWLLGGESA